MHTTTFVLVFSSPATSVIICLLGILHQINNFWKYFPRPKQDVPHHLTFTLKSYKNADRYTSVFLFQCFASSLPVQGSKGDRGVRGPRGRVGRVVSLLRYCKSEQDAEHEDNKMQNLMINSCNDFLLLLFFFLSGKLLSLFFFSI